MKKQLKTLIWASLILSLLSCAKKTWEFHPENSYQRPLERTFVILKGEKETNRFFVEMEMSLKKKFLQSEIIPSFKRLEGSGAIVGEKEDILKECAYLRCEDVLLLSLERRMEKKEGSEEGDAFFEMRMNLIDPLVGKPSWRGRMEFDPSDVLGLGIGLTMNAGQAVDLLIEQLQKEKLLPLSQ